MTRLAHAALALALLLTIGAGCKKPVATEGGGAALTPSAPTLVAKPAVGDAVRGEALVKRFECNRCHQGSRIAEAPLEKDCVGCHRQILDGTFHLKPEPTWKPRVTALARTPSLDRASLFTRAWVESYLQKPHKLRPALSPSMPRLEMSADEARDIAAFLVPEEAPPAKDDVLAGADLAHGREVLDGKGCATCHRMGGVEALKPSPLPAGTTLPGDALSHAVELAPDLRFARDRLTAPRIIAWLSGEMAGKPGISMPKIPLTQEEIRDVTAYLLQAKLLPPPRVAPFERLPVLTRKVTFEEVDKKVFHRTCWHCHSEPDYAIGDGGPGNSGGLGFKPRGLNLADYNSITAGMLDEKGERQSIFARGPGGVPRLVAALAARHVEEAGGEVPGLRGMPLGYRALPAEDIQLVETWIAQGRPR